jgi:serine/threonine protein kinase
MRCSQCGKDVAAEVGPGRWGDYACQSCQTEALSDPAAALVKEMLSRAGSPATPSPSDLSVYELGKKLGEGGMGAVYLARRKRDCAQVALKVMLAKVAVNEYLRQKFLLEIEITRDLRHPNIIELFDYGSAGSGFYFAMELCTGGSVDGLMARRGGKLSLAEAGPIILQVLEGLSFAHDGGFVHRDIKPQNILLTAERSGVAKLADFGLAKNWQKAGLSGMTATGEAAGTPYFMPREQLTNFKYVKPVSDVWSIGSTLYHMLTGDYPRNFQRGQDPMEVILRGGVTPILNRDSNIPKRVAEVSDRSLADNVKARYQTAAEFREALAKAL